MDDLYRLGFLKYASLGQIVAVGDTVYVSPTADISIGQHAIGTLSGFAEHFGSHAARLPEVCGNSPAVEQARKVSAQYHSLHFCLAQLLPALKNKHFLQEKKDEVPYGCETRLGTLAQRCKTFRQEGPKKCLEETISKAFLKQFQPPFLIRDGNLIPLRKVPRAEDKKEFLEISQQCFQLRQKRSRPVQQAIEAIRERGRSHSRLHRRERRRIEALAEQVVVASADIFSLYPSTQRDNYQIIYEDDSHQLQHNAMGDFILVRGPVLHRLISEPVCVALSIRGVSRQDLVSLPPTVGQTREDFWTQDGHPSTNPICMGITWQYEHLRSRQFTDAEAVLQWLDAGVIVATARSEKHRMLYGDSTRDHLVRRLEMLNRRRAPRNAE